MDSLKKQQDSFKAAQVRAAYQNLGVSHQIGSRHINFYLHDAVSYLKNQSRPISIEELRAHIGVDAKTWSDLCIKLKENDRIVLNEGFYTYNSLLHIGSSDDLLQLVRQRTNIDGLAVDEVKEFRNTDDMIKSLCKDRLVFLVSSKEDGPKTLFYNDLPEQVRINPEFMALWGSIALPNTREDIQVHLKSANLKSSRRMARNSDSQIKIAPVNANKKKPRKPFRRIKITNDYLEGIDLSIDFQS